MKLKNQMSVVAKIVVVAVIGFVVGMIGAQSDESWPGWRGPERNGHVAGKAWPASLKKDSLELAWRADLAEGYPGPVVADHRVFTVETQNKEREVVKAFDRHSGELLWEQSWEGAMKVPFFAAKNGSWVRSTPATNGKVLLVGGMREVLHCLSVESGDVLWSLDCVAAFESSMPSFGFVCSPLIVGKNAFVQAGGGVIKLELASGQVVWRRATGGGGMNGGAFSSPVVAEVAGRSQLVVQEREALQGLDLESGEVLWEQKVKAFRGMNIMTPVTYGQGFFTTTYGGRSRLWEVTPDQDGFKVDYAWDNKLQGYMCTPVVVGDHAYFHLRNQRAACVNLETGQIAWVTDDRFGKYWSLVVQGDRILALDESGELILFRANPERFELIDRRKISDSETWGHLTVVDDAIFVRELRGISAWKWSGVTELAQGK